MIICAYCAKFCFVRMLNFDHCWSLLQTVLIIYTKCWSHPPYIVE